jgi:aspartyl-tRNA(Asn)/glutamyl-tRNA(Gln) amidotransferase subunit B
MSVKTIANIIVSILQGISLKENIEIDSIVTKQELIGLAALFDDGKINNQGLLKAIDYFKIHKNTTNFDEEIEKLAILQLNDESALESFVDTVIEKYPAQVTDYKAGKINLIGFFVGKCMEESNKTGNPAKFKILLEKKL